MKLLHVIVRAFLLLAFLLSGLFASVASNVSAAQSGVQSYTSKLSGQVIQTTGGWTIDDAGVENSDGAELIPLFGQYDGMIVAFLPSGTDLVVARDIFLDEFGGVFEILVPIDRGAYGNVSYSLDITSSEGIEFGLFSLFLGERESGFVEYYLYFGPVMVFQQSMTVAQQSVTVGGKKVFENVDPAGLQTLLSANAGITGASTQVPEGNVVESPTQAPTEVPATESSDTTPEDGSAYLKKVKSELDDLQTTLDDFVINFAGLQSDDSASAVAEINRVSAIWVGYPDQAATIVAPPGFDDIDADYQALAQDVGKMGESWTAVVNAIQSGDETSISQTIDDFIAIMDVVETEIDSLNTSINSAGTDSTKTQEAVDKPTAEPTEAPSPTQASTEESVPTDEPTDLTGTSGTSTGRSDINLGGKSGRKTVDKNETETGSKGQASVATDYEDLGLLAEGDYLSPQFDTSITWDVAWYFDEDFSSPIVSDTTAEVDSVTITWIDGPSSIFISMMSADGVTPDDMVAYWVSDDYLVDNASADAEVLLQDTSRSGSSAVLMRDYLDDGTEVLILRSAMCADTKCQTLVMATMISLPDIMSDAYADGRSGIEIDGERLFDVFSPRDITGAIES